MLRTCLFLLLLVVGFNASAGNIRGHVRDAKDTSAMLGVAITVKGMERNAVTDIDGNYEIVNVPDGTYTLEFSYVSYNKASGTVTIAGADATLNMDMKASGQQLQGTTVRTQRKSNTESAVIMEIKKSNLVVSGISAAQISKSQDRNAADVVKRIPGVTIQDDRFITVRGLADRYNTVWLNDAGAPSAEVDKKAFSFDLIPSGLIDRILVFKTPSAELPGDFAGGMVKIYTTSIPDKTVYSLNVQSSYRAGSTGSTFYEQTRHSGDIIGYDNGSRNIPSGIPDNLTPPAGVTPYTAQQKADFTAMFDNDWTRKAITQPLDLRLSGFASNLIPFKNFKLGNTFGVSYASTRTNYNFDRLDYTGSSPDYHYNDLYSQWKINTALMDNVGFVKGNSKIEFKNLFNQTATNAVIQRVNVQDTEVHNAPDVKAYSLGYENKRTYTTQLLGSHHNSADTRKYTWALGYTDLFRNQPDLKRILFQRPQGSTSDYSAQIPFGTVDVVNAGRYYAQLHEKTYSFSHQFTQRIGGHDTGRGIDLSIGNYIEYKKRSFVARELGYLVDRAAASIRQQGLDAIFQPDNFGLGKLNIGENTPLFDSYDASTRLIATFISVSVPIGAQFKVVAGARYENNVVKLAGYNNLNQISPEFKTNYVLPSVNTTYNFTDKSLLRLAYGMTLNRPEYREFAPVYFYDFDLRAGTYGSLYGSSYAEHGDTLKVCTIQNFDARYEWYPAPGEVLHAGVFYKSFKNPIQHIRTPGSSDNGAYSFTNGVDAYVAGAEVELRKNLLFLDDRFGTEFFKSLTLTGNVSVSKSELQLDSVRIKNLIPKGPLEGQSPYVVNVGLFYQNDSNGFQGSLLYNVYGPRLYALGTTAGSGSIGELAFNSLDILLSKSFIKGRYAVSFGVQNLLDNSFRFVDDTNGDNKFDNKSDKPFNTWRPGRYYTLGVKFRL